LEIQGIINDNKIIVGGFKSVSGMDSETEIVEFKQGNDMVVRKKPGRTTYANIVLERGYTATDDLWQWRKNIEDGKIDRRAGSVIILDQDGTTEVVCYNFYEAWPCKWNVFDMDSDSSAMAIEKIELAVEKVERA
jgi:phage tail-like protein